MKKIITSNEYSGFYSNREEAINARKNSDQTNPRYKNFKQSIFHAGDEEQFQRYRNATNGEIGIVNISLSNNIFREFTPFIWSKYKKPTPGTCTNTFRYMFDKFKKGIFIKIKNNQLDVFLPFSKHNFVNEWSHMIEIDPKYRSMEQFFSSIAKTENRKFNPKRVNRYINNWYGNNALVRYEYPIHEGDSNVNIIRNQFIELCKERQVPDIEFFVNRRDFPLLTRNGCEPYNHIWNSKSKPLVSHNYDTYLPILSMCTSSRYADLLMPTWEDWARVQSKDNKFFKSSATQSYCTQTFSRVWSSKTPTAVFRGSSTGCGTDICNNKRLKLAYISKNTKPDKYDVPYIDAGITKWNVRPRKLEGNRYLESIDIARTGLNLVSKLSYHQQSQYKYIINVEGHVSAFRLSMELGMGSVVLIVESEWKLWYHDLLQPYVHYVPVKADLSNIISQIEWCRNNDDKCEEIARNALSFHNTYLSRSSILDYIQNLLIKLKPEMGVYMYNEITPLEIQLEHQLRYITNNLFHPPVNNNNSLSEFPDVKVNEGLLQGIQWIIHMLINTNKLELKNGVPIFKNKLGSVNKYTINDIDFAIKSTSDIKKSKEHIHETFVGTQCTNHLRSQIPNFVYIYAFYKEDDNSVHNVITEYVQGITLFEYIRSEEFTFQGYLNILIQISLAIKVAQNQYGFVHYDLTPWNVIIQPQKNYVTIDYVLSLSNIIRVTTKQVAIIIDYGKSHIIKDDIHYGFVRLYHMSTIQDIISILVTSLSQVLVSKKVPLRDMLTLANFVSNTAYRRSKFRNYQELNQFLRASRKYCDMLSGKCELESLTPIDFIKYIKDSFSHIPQCWKQTNHYSLYTPLSNAKQVFEYSLRTSYYDRLQTYIDIFDNLCNCDLPTSTNRFNTLYIAQKIYYGATTLKNEMESFVISNQQTFDFKYVNNTIDRILNMYIVILDDLPKHPVLYSLCKNNILQQATYDSDTFLHPHIIKTQIEELIQYEKYDNLIEYKNIVETVLLNHDLPFSLGSEDKKYYTDNFRTLLDINPVVMINNIANLHSLIKTSTKLYTLNLRILNEKIQYSESDTYYADQYKNIYKEILNKQYN
jgi:hypothetical protein